MTSVGTRQSKVESEDRQGQLRYGLERPANAIAWFIPVYIMKMKIHSSCEIEYFVETHLCKLCVILRSRVTIGHFCMIGWRFIFGVVRRRRDTCLPSQLSSSVLAEIMKAASLPLWATKVSDTGDVLAWSTCIRDDPCPTLPSNLTRRRRRQTMYGFWVVGFKSHHPPKTNSYDFPRSCRTWKISSPRDTQEMKPLGYWHVRPNIRRTCYPAV